MANTNIILLFSTAPAHTSNYEHIQIRPLLFSRLLNIKILGRIYKLYTSIAAFIIISLHHHHQRFITFLTDPQGRPLMVVYDKAVYLICIIRRKKHLYPFYSSYVSAMVPVKSIKEYDIQVDVIVLFSETLQRALHQNLITQVNAHSWDVGWARCKGSSWSVLNREGAWVAMGGKAFPPLSQTKKIGSFTLEGKIIICNRKKIIMILLASVIKP